MSPLTVVASTTFPVAQVPRVFCSSSADVATLIDTARPVVITLSEERAGRLLTPNDLLTAFGSTPVDVNTAHRENFRSNADSNRLMRRMTFTDFAEYVDNSSHNYSADWLYLSQYSLNTAQMNLGREVSEPGYIPEYCSIVNTNLWFGPAGTVSPLHFDQNHNLLHQHYGRKNVILIHPYHFQALRPGQKNSPSEHISSIDLVTSSFTIDVSQLGFSCFETFLGPGDVLFVPAFWWHHVMSIDTAISINYWWRAPIGACLYPGLFRFLSSRFVYRDPSVVTRAFDFGSHELGTDLCLFLADRGHAFAAAALAGAIVTASCYKALRMLGLTTTHLEDAGFTGDLANFAQARTVIGVFASQDLINASQADLLLKWLELARVTMAEADVPVYPPERARAIRSMIWQLHTECEKWLSMS